MNYTPLGVEYLRKNLHPKKINKLLIALALIFFLLINLIKIDPGKFVNPLGSRDNVFSEVKNHLETIKNPYRLHTPASIVPQVYADANIPDANTYAVIDYDTGNVILQKDMAKTVSIASLTKIMTAVVALDLASPDELFTVSKTAADEIPTKIVVNAGERMSLWELMHASLMTSANDATEVIREGVDAKYGKPIFIDAMNEKAKLIGLKNTHFMNPQGFDDQQHYSTAEDLAILSHYALTNYPLIAEIAQIQQMDLPANPYHHAHHLVNWNGLLGVYPNVFGMKIGNTNWAGTTTVVVSEREGKKILAVLLGASNVLSRDMQTAQLLDAGFEQLAGLDPVNVTEDQLYAKYATWN